ALGVERACVLGSAGLGLLHLRFSANAFPGFAETLCAAQLWPGVCPCCTNSASTLNFACGLRGLGDVSVELGQWRQRRGWRRCGGSHGLVGGTESAAGTPPALARGTGAISTRRFSALPFSSALLATGCSAP